MLRFAYTAIDETGKERHGMVEAETEADALKQLSGQGLYPTNVHRAHIGDDLKKGFRDRAEADRERREKEEARRQREMRKKHPRQRLVAHKKDGSTLYGVSYHLNPTEESFQLDLTDEKGGALDKRERIVFADTKAIYYVRTFDGKFDKAKARREVTPEGPEIVIEFEDGEWFRGIAMRTLNPDAPRFFVAPEDEKSNNMNVLVERSATKQVFTKEEYEAYAAERKEALRKQRQEGGSEITQEETLGDFYFETRSYEAAMEQYEAAYEKTPTERRLRKKLILTKYNVGMGFVKRRDYPTAVEWMEKVLEMDPENEHALKKMKKLRKIVEKMAGGA